MRNVGSTTREGVRGHGLPQDEGFRDEVVAGYRERLALLGDSGVRRAVRDGSGLLATYRLSGKDAAHFEMMFSTLRARRSSAAIQGRFDLRRYEFGHSVAVATH